MRNRLLRVGRNGVVAGIVMTLQGCLFAAAGAGAAGGVYLTSRGAEVVAEGTVADFAARTEAEFSARGIAIESSSIERGGDEREYQGKTSDLDIRVRIRRESSTTAKIEVTARRNLAEWDKRYAEELLARIVSKP